MLQILSFLLILIGCLLFFFMLSVLFNGFELIVSFSLGSSYDFCIKISMSRNYRRVNGKHD